MKPPGALATSRDHPEVVRQYADAINGTGEVLGAIKGLSVEATYKNAFGC